MMWQKLTLPAPAKKYLNEFKITTGERTFSKTQTAMAILHWFARLPLEVRRDIVDRYAQQMSGGVA